MKGEMICSDLAWEVGIFNVVLGCFGKETMPAFYLGALGRRASLSQTAERVTLPPP